MSIFNPFLCIINIRLQSKHVEFYKTEIMHYSSMCIFYNIFPVQSDHKPIKNGPFVAKSHNVSPLKNVVNFLILFGHDHQMRRVKLTFNMIFVILSLMFTLEE